MLERCRFNANLADLIPILDLENVARIRTSTVEPQLNLNLHRKSVCVALHTFFHVEKVEFKYQMFDSYLRVFFRAGKCFLNHLTRPGERF